MLHSTIIDVMVGLAFIYLELSIVCSAATELLESVLRKRATDLEAGIRRLVRDEATLNRVYAHPLIQGLMRDDEAKPSYIPAHVFALVLVDVLGMSTPASLDPKGLDKVEGSLQKALRPLLKASGGEPARFKQYIEDWFDASMERVSGWYKRRTQWIIFGLGFVIAAGFNADTLRLANLLARDGAWRASVVSIAEEHVKASVAGSAANQAETGQAAPSSEGQGAGKAPSLREALQKATDLGLPFGWGAGPEVTGLSSPQLLSLPTQATLPGWLTAWVLKLLGLMVTALAVSLGAPFWFDLLNRLSMVRSASRPDNKDRGASPVDSEQKPESQQQAA
ncbi:hypothetical protein EJ065_3476 [Corallococcus coralloides]|uniref:Uncharacterized protein n=1 Tax=Corallococcus coralloides TaxID=184914 RepID=A0A410RT23_CORCK|nr:hypothetical protein [Corallococcus coralloides]QAT85037.1 hypothetical protein EJ065_3476 [Corallococcus coralloides]